MEVWIGGCYLAMVFALVGMVWELVGVGVELYGETFDDEVVAMAKAKAKDFLGDPVVCLVAKTVVAMAKLATTIVCALVGIGVLLSKMLAVVRVWVKE